MQSAKVLGAYYSECGQSSALDKLSDDSVADRSFFYNVTINILQP